MKQKLEEVINTSQFQRWLNLSNAALSKYEWGKIELMVRKILYQYDMPANIKQSDKYNKRMLLDFDISEHDPESVSSIEEIIQND